MCLQHFCNDFSKYIFVVLVVWFSVILFYYAILSKSLRFIYGYSSDLTSTSTFHPWPPGIWTVKTAVNRASSSRMGFKQKQVVPSCTFSPPMITQKSIEIPTLPTPHIGVLSQVLGSLKFVCLWSGRPFGKNTTTQSCWVESAEGILMAPAIAFTTWVPFCADSPFFHHESWIINLPVMCIRVGQPYAPPKVPWSFVNQRCLRLNGTRLHRSWAYAQSV